MHARQLDHDAVGTLTLNQRLGNTQLVDPVTDSCQVLLDGIFTDFRQLGRGHRQTQHRLTIEVGSGNVEVVKVFANQATCLLTGRLVGKAQLNGAIELRQTAIAQFVFAQQAFDVAFVHFHARVNGLVHVHFQQEMHTTRQVQTQFHRVSTQVTQPLRRGLSQVQCNDIVVTQCLAHHILGRQLIIFARQTQQAALAILGQCRAFHRNTSIFERLARTLQVSFGDLQRRARARHLNCRVIRVEIGSGINKTDRQHRQDQYVFPQRVFVQHQSRRPLRTRGALRAPSIVKS